MSTPIKPATPTTAARKSRASRAADQLAAAPKPTVTPKPAPKPAAATPVKVTKAAAPSLRSFQNALGAAVIANAEKFAETYRIPKDSPMSREDILVAVGKWMSYVPGAWPTDSKLPMISAGGRRNKSA